MSDSRGWRRRASDLLTSLPEGVLVAFLIFGALVSLLTTLGQLRPPLVVVAAVLALLALRWLHLPAPSPQRGGAASVVVLVAGLVWWVAANLSMVSQNVFVGRDPAVYTLTALWLVDHPSTDIPLGDGDFGAPGFNRVDGHLEPQGSHLAPALAAVGGWLWGRHGVLSADLVIGALTLTALYCLARRLSGPWWALLPVSALALSLPFLAVVRSLYSEPLAMCYAVLGVTSLVVAVRDGRRVAWLLSGMSLGAVALARIDGVLPLVGVVAFAGLSAAVAPPDRRELYLPGLPLVLVGATPMVLLGMADLYFRSGPYLHDLRRQVTMLFAVLLSAVAVGLAVRAVSGRPGVFVRRALTGRGAILLGTLVAIAVAVLLTRPLWLVSRAWKADQPFIAGLQGQEGQAIDARRSYDEESLNWLAWYWGWPTLLVALSAVTLATVMGLRSRDRGPLALAAFTLPALFLYATRVNIFPDQIWATRRFLTVVVPGLLVALAWVLSTAWPRARLRVPALLVALLAVAWPISTLPGLWGVVEWGGKLAGAERLCSHISSSPVIMAGGATNASTIRVMCGADVIIVLEPSTDSLAAAVRDAGGEPLQLVTTNPQALPWATAVPAPAVVIRSTRWERSLSRPPADGAVVDDVAFTVAQVRPDGRVVAAS